MFGNLFARKSGPAAAVAPTPVAAAARTRTVSYDSKLVASLKRDHDDLVDLFQRIGQFQQAGKFDEIGTDLVIFKTRLEGHILTENVRFYTYLEQSLGADGHNIELMRDFRREMNTIARGVVEFVKRYQSVAFDAAQRAQFGRDYQAVGALLTQRIEREEDSLYPLYEAG